MERHQFDESWKNAFAEGEITPDASVWTSIELELTHAEKGAMRRRVVFYQRLAAGLALIILVGVGAFYFSPEANGPQQFAENTMEKTSDGQPQPSDNNSGIASTESSKTADTQTPADKELSPTKNDDFGRASALTKKGLPVIDKENTEVATATNLPSQPNFADQHPLVTGLQVEKEPVKIKGKLRVVELARRLPAMPASFMASSKDKEPEGGVWASLGAAAGSYNPNGQGGAVAEAVDAGGVGYLANSAPTLSTGSAYSVGMNAGLKISRRWVVQSGVNYVNQSLDYQSNVASIDASNRTLAYSAQYDAELSSGSFRVTNPYTVNNSIELVSIPVQAGWMAIDRKFGLQLNTGISTDLFVRSTLVDESGQFEKFSQGSGSDSPIRPVNFSGLFSTEMSYRFGDHYGLAIVPGLRYSLAPLSKPGEGNLGNALIWDVGFRLRYHFN